MHAYILLLPACSRTTGLHCSSHTSCPPPACRSRTSAWRPRARRRERPPILADDGPAPTQCTQLWPAGPRQAGPLLLHRLRAILRVCNAPLGTLPWHDTIAAAARPFQKGVERDSHGGVAAGKGAPGCAAPAVRPPKLQSTLPTLNCIRLCLLFSCCCNTRRFLGATHSVGPRDECGRLIPRACRAPSVDSQRACLHVLITPDLVTLCHKAFPQGPALIGGCRRRRAVAAAALRQ